jgi:hypothetical protein
MQEEEEILGRGFGARSGAQFHFTNDLKTHTRAQILVLVAVYVPTESKKLQPPKSKAIFPIPQQGTILYNHTPRNQKNENE